MKDHKWAAAPAIDSLLHAFERGHKNAEGPSESALPAIRMLFLATEDLAPIKGNDEVKAIWLRAPCGGIRCYTPYKSLREWGEVRTYAEYQLRWREDYPDKEKWYRLVLVETKPTERRAGFLGVTVGDRAIASVDLGMPPRPDMMDDGFVTRLCLAILPHIMDAMQALRDGRYNADVEARLPYWERTGVIRRADLWAANAWYREKDWEETDWDMERHLPMTEEILEKCETFLSEGGNADESCGRMPTMTAGAFFRACAIGYAACGYKNTSDGDGVPFPDKKQYLLNADGRTEGLTGEGWRSEEGGLPLDDEAAWDAWYFNPERHGGHPWEVCAGGNSTHVDLCPCNDRLWPRQDPQDGWFFRVAGKHCAAEAVRFFVALREAGFPVVLEDAEEILSRFRGTDWVGIVPHDTTPRYCEGMFPKRYGRVIDFMHVYSDDMAAFGDKVEWLPQPEARLLGDGDPSSANGAPYA